MTPKIPGCRSLARTAAFAALALPCPGLAQEPPEPHDAPPPADVFFIAKGSPVMALGAPVDIVAGHGSVLGEVVTGKPYTADAVTELTQRLGDGNRITHKNTARVYRDADGRTRREHSLASLGVWPTASEEPATMVAIDDPVAGASYILDPGAKTARQMRPVRVVPGAEAGVVTWEAAVPAPPPPDAAATGAVSVVVSAGAIEATRTEAPPPVRGRTVVRALPPMAAAPVVQDFPETESRTEDLGEQNLQGVLAKGTRHTRVIPAGAIGNERAIEIVSEEWYSPELEAVVLRRSHDPRFGETTYQLVNVVRGEPPADLFEVPPDYELTQAPPAFGAIRRMEAPDGAPGGSVDGEKD